MQYGSVKISMLLDTIVSELEAMADGKYDASLFEESLSAIQKAYPLLSDGQCVEILSLAIDAYNYRTNEKVELVVTAPPSFSLKTKTIKNAVITEIADAQKAIIITGYSVSDYVDNLIDALIAKSQQGILVKLYVNSYEKQTSLARIERYKSKFLQIYNYQKTEDKMAALHAKVISVDSHKSLISSANLSFHGMEGNIELGCWVESVKIAKQIEHVMQQLLFQKVFIQL